MMCLRLLRHNIFSCGHHCRLNITIIHKALYSLCTSITIFNRSSTWSICSLTTSAFLGEYSRSFTVFDFLINVLYSLLLHSSSWDDWYSNQRAVCFFFFFPISSLIGQSILWFRLRSPSDCVLVTLDLPLTNAWSSNCLKDSTVPDWSDTLSAAKAPVSKFSRPSLLESPLCVTISYWNLSNWFVSSNNIATIWTKSF